MLNTCSNYWHGKPSGHSDLNRGAVIALASTALLVTAVTILFFTAPSFIRFAQTSPQLFWGLYSLTVLTLLSIPTTLFFMTLYSPAKEKFKQVKQDAHDKKDIPLLDPPAKDPVGEVVVSLDGSSSFSEDAIQCVRLDHIENEPDLVGWKEFADPRLSIDPSLVDLLEPSPFRQHPAASENREGFDFGSLPPDIQLIILKELDPKSVSQFTITNQHNLAAFANCIRRIRFELAALDLWQASLLSKDFVNPRSHTISMTIEIVALQSTDFILNQIRRILNSIHRIPHKGKTLFRIAQSLQGMCLIKPNAVVKVVRQLLDIAVALKLNGEISESEKEKIFTLCMKPLAHDLPYALQCLEQIEEKDTFDVVESLSRFNSREALNYLNRVRYHERGRILSYIIRRIRYRGKEEVREWMPLVLNKLEDLNLAGEVDVLCELAGSYTFIGEFEQACEVAHKTLPKNRERIIEAIANHCKAKGKHTYPRLIKLLAWVKELRAINELRESEPDIGKNAMVAIAQKMAFTHPTEAVEVFQEVCGWQTKGNDWVMMKMSECLLTIDIKEAYKIAQQIKGPHYKIPALVGVAKTFAESDIKQATLIFESAFLECNFLHKDPYGGTRNSEIRIVDFSRVKELANIAQHYALISPKRAKEILTIAIEESSADSYPHDCDVSVAIAKAYFAISPKACIYYIQTQDWMIPMGKSYVLATIAEQIV